MKRVLLVTALLIAGAVSAYADTDVWTASHPRSDEELASANAYCNQRFGVPQNRVPASAAYKRCMASFGWRFVQTKHDDTWVNHRGMTCHPILNGLGSECSSF